MIPRSFLLPPAILACAVVFSGAGHRPAFAQPDGTQATKVLPPVEVVGSRVKRTDLETPTPVEVINQEDIRSTGATSLREVLNSISSSMNGSLQDETALSSGASTVALRGLGSSATLVLLNGRRLVASPYLDATPGQSQIYNINNIPLSAIERIEILKSGASAIYGSDAVAGVVNIVTRTQYHGAEAGIRYSVDQNGNFGNRQIHGIIGFGDTDTENRYGGFLLFANTKRESGLAESGVPNSELKRLFGRDSLSSTASYPPNYYTESSPGSNSFTSFFARDARCPPQQVRPDGLCGYNPGRDVPSVSQLEVSSILGRVDFRVRPSLSLFTEFGLSRAESLYPISPERVFPTGETWFAQDGRRFFWRWVLPAGHPDNPTTTPVALNYRFVDLGPRLLGQVIDTTRILLGAKGQAAGWEWETGLLYNRIHLSWTDKGFINFPAFQDAINSLAYRPFGNNSPETIARISPPLFHDGWTGLASWDVKGSRKLMDMAGGPITLVTGAELRKEEFQLTTDPRKRNGETVNRGASEADADRHVTALFGELSVPFTKTIESQFAVRSDRYSDFGSSTNPQLAIKWKPVSSLAFRGSYARGFRVPSLPQAGGSDIQAFGNIDDPRRCGVPGGTAEDCNRNISVLISSNPNLEPEKSVSQTFGLIFAPNANFDMSLDFYRIDQKNETGLLSDTFILENEAQFPGAVIRNPDPATWIPGVPNSGPVTSMLRRYTNLGRTRTSGVDMETNLRTSLGKWGSLRTRFSGSYVHKYETKVDATSPFIESRGYFGPFGGQPPFKGSLSSTWIYRGVALTGRVNHIAGWRFGSREVPCFTSNAAFIASYDCKIKSWTIADISLGYTATKNLELGASVRNVTNKVAPIDPGYVPFFDFNPTFHNPYGRYFTVWLNYKFM